MGDVEIRAEMRGLIEEAIVAWFNKNASKEEVFRYVTKKLDEARDHLIMSLMGFERRSGGITQPRYWSVDHCNGRAGESAAGDFLKASVEHGTRAWLSEQAGNLPELNKETVDGLKREYLNRLHRDLQSKLRDLAKKKAESALEEVATDLLVELMNGDVKIFKPDDR